MTGMPPRNVKRRSYVRNAPEVADRICAGLAEGRKLADICADEGMPGRRTVFRWLAADVDFLARYDRSCKARARMGYSLPLAMAICDQLAEGRSLVSIRSDAGMPGRTAIYGWLGQHPEFRELYDRAREWQAASLLDEVLDIADDGRNDWMQRRGKDDAGWVANGENLRRSKMRLDTRKWALARLSKTGSGAKRHTNAPVVKVVREIVRPGLKKGEG